MLCLFGSLVRMILNESPVTFKGLTRPKLVFLEVINATVLSTSE